MYLNTYDVPCKTLHDAVDLVEIYNTFEREEMSGYFADLNFFIIIAFPHNPYELMVRTSSPIAISWAAY